MNDVLHDDWYECRYSDVGVLLVLFIVEWLRGIKKGIIKGSSPKSIHVQ